MSLLSCTALRKDPRTPEAPKKAHAVLRLKRWTVNDEADNVKGDWLIPSEQGDAVLDEDVVRARTRLQHVSMVAESSRRVRRQSRGQLHDGLRGADTSASRRKCRRRHTTRGQAGQRQPLTALFAEHVARETTR